VFVVLSKRVIEEVFVLWFVFVKSFFIGIIVGFIVLGRSLYCVKLVLRIGARGVVILAVPG
jgi:hypothetical protein